MKKRDKFERVKELMAKGFTAIEIADKMNISRSNAWYWVKQVEPKRLVGSIEENTKRILELYHEGKGDEEIAQIVNLAPNTVRYYRSRAGAMRRVTPEPEEYHIDYDALRMKLITQEWRGEIAA